MTELEFVDDSSSGVAEEHHPQITFVDDWSPLKEAVNVLAPEPNALWQRYVGLMYDDESGLLESTKDALDVVNKYVPALIEQYSKLLELSFMLTEAWDMANQNRTPSGLIVEEFKL